MNTSYMTNSWRIRIPRSGWSTLFQLTTWWWIPVSWRFHLRLQRSRPWVFLFLLIGRWLFQKQYKIQSILKRSFHLQRRKWGRKGRLGVNSALRIYFCWWRHLDRVRDLWSTGLYINMPHIVKRGESGHHLGWIGTEFHGLERCRLNVSFIQVYQGTDKTRNSSWSNTFIYTHIILYKNILFSAQAGKEIQIATSKSTTMFLKYWHFEPERSYKKCCYKKNCVILNHFASIYSACPDSHLSVYLSLPVCPNVCLNVCHFVSGHEKEEGMYHKTSQVCYHLTFEHVEGLELLVHFMSYHAITRL